MTLLALTIGPMRFDAPAWLVLAPVLWALSVLIARKSLSGLGGASRWTALGIRALVILLLVGALAEPNWRKTSKDVSVTFLVDVSESVPAAMETRVADYVRQVRERGAAAYPNRADRLGVVTVARDALVQTLPSRLAREMERVSLGRLDASNLASGLRMAMAVLPKDAANRIVIASDGNETAGSLFQAAEAARAAGIPIDVLPLRYRHESEVIVDKLVAPSTARRGENMTLRVVLTATRETTGRLTVLMDGEPLDLDPEGASNAASIALRAGTNMIPIPVTAGASGPRRFEAVFEPMDGNEGDRITQNNKALAVTFVAGEGRVLVLSRSTQESAELVSALRAAKLEVEERETVSAPEDLTALNAYEAVVLVNVAAFDLSTRQQEDLKQYVHDSGGGLVMVGGPESFGAGGWIGSPLAEALPIRLDPPQKRQMPRGALVLVIHSVEIPNGVFYGQKVAEAAVEALSRLDLIGINEYGMGGTQWVHPLSLVGDGSLVKQRVRNLAFGDMPDFSPSIKMSYDALVAADAGQKHVIVISDGDPTLPPSSLLQRYRDARITISTVGIGVHGINEQNNLKALSIGRGGREGTGGRHYDVAQGDVASLPQIFIKEAQTVRRSLIWEGPAFTPTVTGGAAETLRGIGGSVPAITGYVVAADREGLALVTLRGKENDPILAQWQHGLGKVVTFTSDASTRWAGAWVGWPQFRAFWEQHVRWAMRPGGSATTRVATENRGDETLIVVDAVDAAGERLNFANFTGRVALPDGTGEDVTLRQVGPGRYEGVVRTDQPGAYVATMKYVAPGRGGGEPMTGTVQAAISRPFADEYRALEDNAAVLQQVADLTGGRVLSFNPAEDELWDREGLRFPVASRSIWLYLAVAGIGLFLADVGVRRVRVDVRAAARSAASVFKRSKAATGAEIGTLRKAREQAREKIRDRGERGVGGPAAGERASVKFEADESVVRRGARVEMETPTEVSAERREPARKPAEQKPGAGDEQGMSALLKAKKRARDEMGDGNQ